MGDPVNKQEMISAVAASAGLTKTQAGEAINALTSLITDTLKKGEEFQIADFGKFSVTERGATKGRNPRTGEEIDIPASKRPTFKAAKKFKDGIA